MSSVSGTAPTGKVFLWRGVASITVGVLLMIFTAPLAELVVELFLLYVLLTSVADVVLRLVGRRRGKGSLWGSLIRIVVVLVLGSLEIFSVISVYLFILLLGIYELLMAFINAVTWFIYRDNGIRPRWRFLFNATWLTALGISALFSPAAETDGQLVLLGLYLVMRGVTDLRDWATFDRETEARRKGRRSRVSLPIVIAALIPRATLQKVNDLLAVEEPSESGQGSGSPSPGYDLAKPGARPDLEVFIHVTESGFGAIGHVDLAYRGIVYSYGNYDDSSGRLFGMMGDGVLFRVERDRYVEFCKQESRKTLFGYGIVLDEEQRRAVEDQLEQIHAMTQPWSPGAVEAGKETYAHKLAERTGAELFKFTSSKFRTYFVLSTNCVLLADSVIGRTGSDILNASGFIAPGTYQDYLNREFDKPGSFVVTRSAYQ